MTAQAHDTITAGPAARPAQPHDTTTARPTRRADAGRVRLSQRDIDGLMLTGEHYGAPADLLAAALRVDPGGFPAIAARSVVTRAAASLRPGERSRIVIRDLPATAFTREPPR